MPVLGETFDLGRVLQTAEAIKAQRRQVGEDALRQQYLGVQLGNAKQAGTIAAAQEARTVAQVSDEQRLQDMTILHRAATQVETAEDPISAAHGLLASPEIAQIFKRHGIDASQFEGVAGLPPGQIRQNAAQMRQQFEPFVQPPKATDDPTEIRTLRALQKDPELLALHKQLQAAGANREAPANVQEWQYYNRLAPEQKAAYLEMKRSQQTFLPTIAQVPTVVRPGVAGNPTQMQPLSNLPTVANAAATVAGAEAGAKTTETATAEARVSLQSNLDEIRKMEQGVQGLLQSPGFDTIYGLSGKIDPRNYTPGTEAANAEARRNQLEAASFGISVQKMRGLGQLSNAEGQKVTAAYTRAIDKRQSEGSARTAWQEVQSYLELAKLRAQQKAGGASGAAAAPEVDPLGIR